MFFSPNNSSQELAGMQWQIELLLDYIMDTIDCTLEQANKLIALREQLAMNSEMMERVQEQRRLAFARYLVEHKYLREDVFEN
jgi:hypothetical protein